MANTSNPYKPYAESHRTLGGPGDSRPSAVQVVEDCNGIGKLKGKTILITGCSSGLGIETARALYETEATLFLTARDMAKLRSVIDEIVQSAKYNRDGPKPQAVELHLDSLDSVRRGAEDFIQRSGGKLNILINNAGVMACPYTTTKDELEIQIGVNHFAHFLLFHLLKSYLLASAKESGSTSRVINLTSSGHRFAPLQFSSKAELDAWNKGGGYERWAAYGSAKTANIYMATSITRHYGSQNLHGWSVHPGGILTKLTRHLSQEDFALFGEDTSFIKNPSQGAATTVWAAVSNHFEGDNGGRYLADVGETALATGSMQFDPGYGEWVYDKEKEENLWKISCEIVGVTDD